MARPKPVCELCSDCPNAMKSVRLPSIVGAAMAADAANAIVQADTIASIEANRARLREREDSGLQFMFDQPPPNRAGSGGSTADPPEGGGSNTETSCKKQHGISAAP